MYVHVQCNLQTFSGSNRQKNTKDTFSLSSKIRCSYTKKRVDVFLKCDLLSSKSTKKLVEKVLHTAVSQIQTRFEQMDFTKKLQLPTKTSRWEKTKLTDI